MRSDMKSVIIETVRHGGKYLRESPLRIKHLNDEQLADMPTKDTSKGKRTKSLADRLAPLYRFLQSKVGKPWNEVYSEICKENSAKNVRGWHLRLHVEQAVELKATVDKNGKVYDSDRRLELYPQQFYVDPKGFLRLYKAGHSRKFPWGRHEEDATGDKTMHLDRKHCLARIGGIWYEIVLKLYEVKYRVYPWDGTRVVIQPPDILKMFSESERKRAYGHTDLYGDSKRQLNKRELRRYGVKNDLQ